MTFNINFQTGALDDDEDRIAILVNGKLVYADRLRHGEQVTFTNEATGHTIKEHIMPGEEVGGGR